MCVFGTHVLKAYLEPFRLFQAPFNNVEHLGFEIRWHGLMNRGFAATSVVFESSMLARQSYLLKSMLILEEPKEPKEPSRCDVHGVSTQETT